MIYKEFKISEIFTQERGKESSPSRVLDGHVPMIAEIDSNNGFTKFAKPTKIFKGNAITISVNFAQNVFYQPVDFCASVNILIIRNDFLNEKNAQYICSVLRKNNAKYDYQNKISKERLNDTVVLLPSSDGINPDYNYMDTIIRKLEHNCIRDLDTYLTVTELNDYMLTDKEKEILSKPVNNKLFKIGDIFKPLKVGYIGKSKKIGSAKKTKNDEYCIPLTCAKTGDNGIMYWAKKGDFITYNNAISIIADGAVSAGLVYAQPDEAGAYSHSYFIQLKNNNVDFRTNIYLACCLNKVIYPKYSRENAPRWNNKVENDYIILPTTDGTNPDYEYMEQYIRVIEKLVIKDVVEYKDKIIKAAK